MRPAIADEFEPPFLSPSRPRQSVPFVFNVPHAGRASTRRPFSPSRASTPSPCAAPRTPSWTSSSPPTVELGAPLMAARFPRAFLDLNREPYELDPRMFEGRLPPFANTRSMRVAGGLGTIPRIVADGQEIYRGRTARSTRRLRRIEWLYKPYHRMLRQLVHRTAARLRPCGPDRLPFHAVDEREPRGRSEGRHRPRRPLRDKLRGLLTDLVDATLRQPRAIRVVRNKPYAGGFITEHYGEPALGRHALQIEINRALYMDERSLRGAAIATLSAISTASRNDLAEVVSPSRHAAE